MEAPYAHAPLPPRGRQPKRRGWVRASSVSPLPSPFAGIVALVAPRAYVCRNPSSTTRTNRDQGHISNYSGGIGIDRHGGGRRKLQCRLGPNPPFFPYHALLR